MSKITTIVGWDGDHPTHEACVTHAFEGSEVVFLPPSSNRNEVALAAIPKNSEGKWVPEEATIILLNSCSASLVKQLKVLTKKGATVHVGWGLPWEGEATDENALEWAKTGQWPEEVEEDSLEDLFGDDLFDEDEVDEGEGEGDPAAPAQLGHVGAQPTEGLEQPTHRTSPVPDATSPAEEDAPEPVQDEVEEDFASPLDEVLGGGMLDTPAEEPPRTPPAPTLPPAPSREADSEEETEAMTSVIDTVTGGSDDFVATQIERDVDIPANGGPAKSSPREMNSERDGGGTRGGNSGGGDSDPLQPSEDFAVEYAGLPEGFQVDPMQPTEEGEDKVSLEDLQDVRGVDEDEKRHRAEARAMAHRKMGRIEALDAPESYVTRENPSAVVAPRIPSEEDAIHAAPEEDPPYIRDLPEGARASQRERANEGALGEYTRQEDYMGNSSLFYCGGASGGTGKSFVTYGMAHAAAASYDLMRRESTSENKSLWKKINRPVYLVEADYTNPDLEHYLSRDDQHRVNTIRPLITEMERRDYNLTEEEVLELASSCTTLAKGSSLKILPCPSDLREVEENNRAVIFTITALISALLRQPGGAVVFVDGVNITTPSSSVLASSLLDIGSPKVFLVVNPDKEEEAVRAMEFLVTKRDGEVAAPYGRGRTGRVVRGYGLNKEDVAVFLNQIPVTTGSSEELSEVYMRFQANTALTPAGWAPKFKGYEHTGWAGEFDSTGDRDKFAYLCLAALSRPSGGGMLELKPVVDKLSKAPKQSTARRGGTLSKLKRKVFG